MFCLCIYVCVVVDVKDDVKKKFCYRADDADVVIVAVVFVVCNLISFIIHSLYVLHTFTTECLEVYVRVCAQCYVLETACGLESGRSKSL